MPENEQQTVLVDRRWDDPTPQEIRLACLRIQATWTEEERRFRAGLHTSWRRRAEDLAAPQFGSAQTV